MPCCSQMAWFEKGFGFRSYLFGTDGLERLRTKQRRKPQIVKCHLYYNVEIHGKGHCALGHQRSGHREEVALEGLDTSSWCGGMLIAQRGV